MHWNSAKRALRYLITTLNYGLVYRRGTATPNIAHAYSDSDWAGDIDTRRSCSGRLHMLNGAGTSWRSRLQPVVALSSTEAEYIALCDAARETVWHRMLLEQLGFPQKGPTKILEDNNGCAAIANNRRSDARTKHIDVKYHYVRDLIEQGQVDIDRCDTEKMVADLLTKALSINKYAWCRQRMGVIHI